MSRTVFIAAITPVLLLAACGPSQTQQEEAAPPAQPAATAQPEVDAPAPPAVAPPPAENGVDDGIPDLTPPKLTPEAERGVKGARNILLSFARAIEEKEYGQAWALLSPADKQKWDRAEFAAIFADLPKTTVAVPDGTMEGAAGSSYYTAPVTITANDTDGRPVRIEGEAVLRRVNDVDGATPEQLRWHFESLTLDPTH